VPVYSPVTSIVTPPSVGKDLGANVGKATYGTTLGSLLIGDDARVEAVSISSTVQDISDKGTWAVKYPSTLITSTTTQDVILVFTPLPGYLADLSGVPLNDSGFVPAEVTVTLTALPPVDTTQLEAETAASITAIDNVTIALAEENYPDGALATLQAAVDAANIILGNPWIVTQPEVDAAYALVHDALIALEHDHPVIFHSTNNLPITDTSGGLIIRIKGEFTTIISVSIDGEPVTLNQTSPISHNVIHGTIGAGTLTKGSAQMNFTTGYLDTLANGRHTIVVAFADPHGTGTGTGTFDLAIPSKTTPGTFPDTGDTTPLAPLVVLIAALIISGSALVVFSRRQPQRSRSRGAHSR
jgi:hypothetical protein